MGRVVGIRRTRGPWSDGWGTHSRPDSRLSSGQPVLRHVRTRRQVQQLAQRRSFGSSEASAILNASGNEILEANDINTLTRSFLRRPASANPVFARGFPLRRGCGPEPALPNSSGECASREETAAPRHKHTRAHRLCARRGSPECALQ